MATPGQKAEAEYQDWIKKTKIRSEQEWSDSRAVMRAFAAWLQTEVIASEVEDRAPLYRNRFFTDCNGPIFTTQLKRIRQKRAYDSYSENTALSVACV